MSIVNVVAIITTKPGMRASVLSAFNANIRAVHAENGCIEYAPTIDTKNVGPFQTEVGPNTFVVIEKWETLEHLMAHALAPHMVTYGAKVKDMLADRVIHILSSAS
jgi:quinol monooxygenase YgiN